MKISSEKAKNYHHCRAVLKLIGLIFKYEYQILTSRIFLFPQEKTNWLPVFIAAGMAGLAVLFIIGSVVAYVKGQNKTEKKPKTDTPDKGTI